jgi:hypothetical protein
LQSWETAPNRPGEFKLQRVEGTDPKGAEQIVPMAIEEAVPMAAFGTGPIVIEKVAPIAIAEVTPIAAESTPEEAFHADLEEKPYESPSRLNGLRGLIFSIGLKNLGKARGLAPLEDESPLIPKSESKSKPVPEPEDMAVARPFTPFAEPVPVVPSPAEVKSASNSAREVTTLPEFLPPKEFTPVRERESGRETGSLSRNDRRDAFDELQILPSRRGQYKRRG